MAFSGARTAIILINRGLSVKVEDIPTINGNNDGKYYAKNNLKNIMTNNDPFTDEFTSH